MDERVSELLEKFEMIFKLIHFDEDAFSDLFADIPGTMLPGESSKDFGVVGDLQLPDDGVEDVLEYAFNHENELYESSRLLLVDDLSSPECQRPATCVKA